MDFLGISPTNLVTVTESYNTLLAIVAANPGITAEEIIDDVADHSLGEENLERLLEKAVNLNDLVTFDDRCWVMRKGRYAFTEYNHTET